jgi:hypothetical protein
MKSPEAKVLAERRLLYRGKNDHTHREAVFQVCEPLPASVSDAPGGEAYACEVRIAGLNERGEQYFGMDAVQALQLASDLDPLIKRLSSKYDFFWSTGDPYFD